MPAVVLATALALLALLQLPPLAFAYGVQSKPKQEPIPRIAELAGVRIGYSTQEDLARHWGEGKTVIGGHPNSGRVWRIKATSWVLHTDGFEYSERGLLVDELEVLEDAEIGKDAPYATLGSKKFAWLGGVTLGMSRAMVKEFLKRKSLSLTETARGFEVTANGFYPLVSVRQQLKKWTVRLDFTNDHLTKLTVGASW